MKDIKWLNHVIELVIVILGISVAFSIDKYSENRKEQKRELIFLESFLDEINDDIPKLDTILIKIGNIDQSLHKVTNLIRGQNQNIDSLKEYIGSAIYSVYAQDLKTATFESLQSSGSLDIIENFELRKEIINYNGLIEDLEFIKDWDFKHHNEESLEYLPKFISASNHDLLTDPKLYALTGVRIFLIKTSISRYKGLKEKALELKKLIEEEL
ncbi:hypothetical protein INQ51_03280 [Maribellus sp. CM-23]|uniref:DUF6090 family protein n=1 Tax=Maribellus sp. CM-23 TaxID=2781026 RepID=UPI001F48CE96|nr:DUF6090 family protein [Maribellus sp. CM-23]MCE4563323.1 hypothetical protein [Maribellus sp. CM-23]